MKEKLYLCHHFDVGNIVPKEYKPGIWRTWNARLLIYDGCSKDFSSYDECWDFIKKASRNM